MGENTGLIFDIQSFSVHDGPGCRTSVFFSGCPLRCQWCANPESWEKKKHVMVAQTKCKWDQGCRACISACPSGSIAFDDQGMIQIDRDICTTCTSFDCVAICPNNALKQCVREYSLDELETILKRDQSNWGPLGGVTFTGGDPLLSAPFLKQVLRRCRSSRIHTAIETSACVPEEIFLDVMSDIDFAFIDIKHMDRQRHHEGTGVFNDRILSNIRALKRSGWEGRLVLRQATIGGFNDSDENALALIAFMKENNLVEINLLKFHRLGASKWQQLGLPFAFHDTGDVHRERLLELQQLYLDHNIACYVEDNTPF